MSKLTKPDMAKVEDAVRNLLETLNLDINDDHLKDTPRRIAKMYIQEVFSGLYSDPPKITTFPTNGVSNVVFVDNITVKSMCSHHFMPFFGKAVIAYLPSSEIIGLSKFSRIVDYFARRPQVQENLTNQIADFIYGTCSPSFVIVGLKCRHLCLTCRGPNDSAVMETLTFRKSNLYETPDPSPYIDTVLDRLRQLEIDRF